MFREELHPRDSGRFASKPGSQGQHSNGSGASGPNGSSDAHSQAVPPQIRESEKRRLLQMMGDNPTPQKEKHVLTSEASRLHTKARGLLDEVKGSRDQQDSAAHQRGAQRHQGAEQKRQVEDAARQKKGLSPKDRAKEQAVRKARDKARTRKPGSTQNAQSTPKAEPRAQLKEVYFRLVVVRDMARARGVKL